MDKTKEPGIIFENIYFTNILYDQKDFNYGNELNIELILNTKATFTNDNKQLTMEIDCSVFREIDLKLKCSALFRVDENAENMDITDFAKTNAPAIVFPYIREAISSIIGRTMLPPLYLPPINIVNLLQK